MPLSSENVPAGQREQAFDSADDLKKPTGQIVGQDVPVPLHWNPFGHLEQEVDCSLRVKNPG